jgi:hypothetical protein
VAENPNDPLYYNCKNNAQLRDALTAKWASLDHEEFVGNLCRSYKQRVLKPIIDSNGSASGF